MESRALARSLAPLHEESLPGYLLRLAHRLGQSPLRIASLCGLTHQRQRIPADHLLALPGDAASVLAMATRLSAAEVNNLALRSFVNTYPALGRARADFARATAVFGDNWVLSYSSRYCPQCLIGDTSPIQRGHGGPWKLRWHLPVVFARPVHHRLLESRCPACGNVLNATRRGYTSLITRPAIRELHPHQCRNAQAGDGAGRWLRTCGARLDLPSGASATLPDEALGRILALQERLDQRLAPGRRMARRMAIVDEQPDNSYFLDLVTASQLIKLSWPAGSALAPSDSVAALIDEHVAPILAVLKTKPAATGPNARIPGLWTAPEDTAQCGALLLAAEALLHDRDSDPAALRAQVQPLARRAFELTPSNTYRNFLGRSAFSPILARALVRQIDGFHAAGCHEHASLRIPSRDCLFTAEEVPSYLPQAWYDRYFAGFTDRTPHTTNWTARHLRRATSLKLVEMTAGGSWTHCATTLGIPVGAAARTLAVLRLQLAGTDLWSVFEATVDHIARDLDTNPTRVNYATRRRALTCWHMPEADWAELCADIPKLGRMMARTGGPAVGSVLVWAQATQSEHIHSPILTDMRRAGLATSPVSNQVAQLLTPASQKGGRLKLLRRLDRYATHLADHCDTVRTAPFR